MALLVQLPIQIYLFHLRVALNSVALGLSFRSDLKYEQESGFVCD